MKTKLALSILVASLGFTSMAQLAPPGKPAPMPVDAMLKMAGATAQRDGKALFVSFHASWCGWCHKMEDVLSQAPVKAVMDKYFVPVSVVVLENGDKKVLENPGGAELLKSAHGDQGGIPFFYFAEPSTKVIINSNTDTEKQTGNIGCPYAKEELDHFVKMLKAGAPKMSDAEIGTIRSAFEAAAKKDGH